jgi:hypothetical protein
MNVWVLTWEPDHSNSDVRAVATTPELAMEAAERDANRRLYWTRTESDGRVYWTAEPGSNRFEGYEIHSHEVIGS